MERSDKLIGDSSPLPYGRQCLDDEDISAVMSVLAGEWLTTGPSVEDFERQFAEYVGVPFAAAVSSGTAALHAAMYAIGITRGDEVIVPAMTFAATANCVVFQGGTPVFADVDPETLLIDPHDVENKITSNTRALIAVDYAGQPCNYDLLKSICNRYNLVLVADACHSLGASYKGIPVGRIADISAFSFHPVKPITTCEGGMVTTANPEWVAKIRMFRNHGITKDHRQRDREQSWFYEMVDLGYNYRLSDMQCALGSSQLKKLPKWTMRRHEIAKRYDRHFSSRSAIRPLLHLDERGHSYHLYVIRVNDRDKVFHFMRSQKIGVQVHYVPVHLHPFYRQRFGAGAGLCPNAEAAFKMILSLPVFPKMQDNEVDRVADLICRSNE